MENRLLLFLSNLRVSLFIDIIYYLLFIIDIASVNIGEIKRLHTSRLPRRMFTSKSYGIQTLNISYEITYIFLLTLTNFLYVMCQDTTEQKFSVEVS